MLAVKQKRKRTGAEPLDGAPARFFENQLAGEEGLSFETGKRLSELSAGLWVLQPWNVLGDEDLILLQDPATGDMCHCSVMGALGEVFSLHIYLGDDGYRFFRRIAKGKDVTPGDFFATQRCLSLEFVRIPELTPPDRALLRDIGYPMRKGVRVPIFRAFRPGYYPWYVTQPEGKLLASCLQAALTFCHGLKPGSDLSYWDHEGVYPFLTPVGRNENRHDYEMKLVELDEPPAAQPQIPQLDPVDIEEIRRRNFPSAGILEADHFLSGAMVGEKNQRKACLSVGLVTDASTGFLFPPALSKPGQSSGDILVYAILSAVRTGRRIPKEVHLSHAELKPLLEPLALALGFSVRRVKTIPSLEEAKQSLLAMMGGY